MFSPTCQSCIKFKYTSLASITIVIVRQELVVSGVAWESAEVLSNYLIAHPEIVRNRNALKLGAGIGLCSIVASHLMVTVLYIHKKLCSSYTVAKQVNKKSMQQCSVSFFSQIKIERIYWIPDTGYFGEFFRISTGFWIVVNTFFNHFFRFYVQFSS